MKMFLGIYLINSEGLGVTEQFIICHITQVPHRPRDVKATKAEREFCCIRFWLFVLPAMERKDITRRHISSTMYTAKL